VGENAVDPPLQMLRALPLFGLIPLFILRADVIVCSTSRSAPWTPWPRSPSARSANQVGGHGNRLVITGSLHQEPLCRRTTGRNP
jgi:hypothetical protein